MLTRIEVDGFKNLSKVAIDLGPYTCVAGPNGVGKSNLFDAIAFLTLLADHPIMEAARLIRATEGRSSDPRVLFTEGTDRSTVGEMRFAAEMIVPQDVVDDFGRGAEPTSTFLRYELALGFANGDKGEPFGRIELRSETLSRIKSGSAAHHLPWPHSKAHFRDKVLRGQRKAPRYIYTDVESDGTVVIKTHQDGGSRGQPKPSAASNAPRTVVGTTTTTSDPTILAARREMQSWRTLMLEPSALRAADGFDSPARVSASGGHLPATLHRLAGQRVAEGGEEVDAYAEVAARASALTDVREVRVHRDEARETLTLECRLGQGGFLPARALSDGTLRFLALCIIDLDPLAAGLICMEEPENGIHPSRLPAMVDLVRGLAVDPSEPPGVENPFRQVIVNTHSPGFVQLQVEPDLLLAHSVAARLGETIANVPRFSPLVGTWRATSSDAVTYATIVDYLVSPPDAPLRLADFAA